VNCIQAALETAGVEFIPENGFKAGSIYWPIVTNLDGRHLGANGFRETTWMQARQSYQTRSRSKFDT
jgi:hypothetical protein